jgi:hypothetical protein
MTTTLDYKIQEQQRIRAEQIEPSRDLSANELDDLSNQTTHHGILFTAHELPKMDNPEHYLDMFNE